MKLIPCPNGYTSEMRAAWEEAEGAAHEILALPGIAPRAEGVTDLDRAWRAVDALKALRHMDMEFEAARWPCTTTPVAPCLRESRDKAERS